MLLPGVLLALQTRKMEKSVQSLGGMKAYISLLHIRWKAFCIISVCHITESLIIISIAGRRNKKRHTHKL